MSETPKWYIFALIAAFSAALFVLIVFASINDSDMQDQCMKNGGEVITGIGYMGRGWKCKVKTANVGIQG